jgi:hypothetical protein
LPADASGFVQKTHVTMFAGIKIVVDENGFVLKQTCQRLSITITQGRDENRTVRQRTQSDLSRPFFKLIKTFDGLKEGTLLGMLKT